MTTAGTPTPTPAVGEQPNGSPPARMHRHCPVPACGSLVFGDSEDALQIALYRHTLSCHVVC
ncbi:hypothetical protein GCM10023148_32360 [Actinokineospora soli]